MPRSFLLTTTQEAASASHQPSSHQPTCTALSVVQHFDRPCWPRARRASNLALRRESAFAVVTCT